MNRKMYEYRWLHDNDLPLLLMFIVPLKIEQFNYAIRISEKRNITISNIRKCTNIRNENLIFGFEKHTRIWRKSFI